MQDNYINYVHVTELDWQNPDSLYSAVYNGIVNHGAKIVGSLLNSTHKVTCPHFIDQCSKCVAPWSVKMRDLYKSNGNATHVECLQANWTWLPTIFSPWNYVHKTVHGCQFPCFILQINVTHRIAHCASHRHIHRTVTCHSLNNFNHVNSWTIFHKVSMLFLSLFHF